MIVCLCVHNNNTTARKSGRLDIFGHVYNDNLGMQENYLGLKILMKAARDGGVLEAVLRHGSAAAVLWLAGVGWLGVPAASTVQSPGPRPPASSGPLQTSSPENWRHSALWQYTRTSSTFRHTLGVNGQEKPNNTLH